MLHRDISIDYEYSVEDTANRKLNINCQRPCTTSMLIMCIMSVSLAAINNENIENFLIDGRWSSSEVVYKRLSTTETEL